VIRNRAPISFDSTNVPGGLVARLAACFRDDCAQQEISFEPMPRTSDGLGGHKKRCHGTLVVADAFADQEVIFPPRAVIDAMGRIGVNQIGLPRHRGVHMTVEDQAVAAASAAQGSQHVESVVQ
jgi:hypothetical protein